MPQQLEFRISSALKNIIGRDLITDDFIAVFELVKNSYDAYAKRVVITFTDDKIVIADDGKGMSARDLKKKWLFVAYSAKHEGVEDDDIKEIRDYRSRIRAKKYFAGAKGIGRFSCDRLGQKLTLFTRKIGTRAIEKLEVDWGKFDVDAEREFVDVKVQHSRVQTTPYPDFTQGTILEITGLPTEGWSREKLKQLKHSLEKLINPLGTIGENDPVHDFSIKIICDREAEEDKEQKLDRDRVNGPVRNFVFETLNIKTTQVITTIDKKSIRTKLIDRGRQIYEISEPNKSYPLLEDVNFHLFFLNRKAKQNFSLQMGLQPVEFGSIFLFKNGFRVYPFGNEGDDSLELDYRKQQGYARRLGTRDLIGRIEIFSNSRQFREVSSRDGGLVRTPGYIQLIEAFYETCLKRLEKYVVDIQWAYKLDETLRDDKDRDDTSLLETIGSKSRIVNLIGKLADNKAVSILEYDKDFLNIINAKVEEVVPEAFRDLAKIADKTQDASFRARILSAEKKYLKAIHELAESERGRERAEEAERAATERLEIEQQKNTYLLATRRSLSEDAEGLIHNIKISTVAISDGVTRLLRKIRTGKLKENELLKELENINFYSDRAQKISKLITRANFRSDRNKQTVDLGSYIEQYFQLYGDIYDRNQLQFEVNPAQAPFHERVSVLDLSLVLDNLISNAEKWKATKILVDVINEGESALKVVISDNGPGLSKKYLSNPSQIFELGVTESDGSGIGLFTARKVLQRMGAEIEFLGNGVNLKGAAFQITFTNA